ncbi:MAG TPA: mechanosensitive ion channel family protein [Thermoanaerobaculia bacterium]|jgi:small-conductance mechanosensitive channel
MQDSTANDAAWLRGIWEPVSGYLTAQKLVDWALAALVLLVGLLAARLARATFRRLIGVRLRAQHSLVAEKGIFYAVLGLAAITALHAAGADPSVLLGAAGILTLALGFASQTTVSNLISGLFLVGEQALKVGDLIRVGANEGYVVSIDLLSIKLRTFNNVLVRLPNETLLKSEIVNLSHYPIRRLDIALGVAYKEDLGRVQDVLLETAAKNPYCLDEPKPLFLVTGYGDSAVLLQFSVWFTRDTYWESIHRMRQRAFEALTAAGVEIPFPHRSIYAGSVTEPFPVRVVGGEDASGR